jgi:hypothetical protein
LKRATLLRLFNTAWSVTYQGPRPERVLDEWVVIELTYRAVELAEHSTPTRAKRRHSPAGSVDSLEGNASDGRDVADSTIKVGTSGFGYPAER